MPRSFLLYLLTALLLAAPAFSAEKKRKDEPKLPKPPPQPVKQEIAVKRGDSVDIRLTIHGRVYQNLKYLIRTGPDSGGKLSEPRVVEQEASVVTYQTPKNLVIKHDHFTYAVQNSDGVSAPVDVGITIVDDAAQLIVPDVVDFAPLLAGGAALKEMEISNIGGGVAEGEVIAAEPFRIEGPTAYKLAAGARQKFLLFFEPKTGAVFRSELRYTSQPDRVTTLRGKGEAAITTDPAELRLQGASGETARLGRVEITNNTNTEQVLTLSASARLRVPGTLTIAAGGKEGVTVSLEERDPRALEEVLTIDGAGLQSRVPVHATAVGPVLKVAEEVLHFPPLRRGRPGSLSLKLENIGGTEGFWKGQAPAPFQMEPANVRLAAGEKKDVRVSVATDETGSLRGVLRLEGEQHTREVRLEAEVIEASTNPAPSTPRPVRTAEADRPAHEKTPVDKATDARVATLLYLRDGVKVTNVQPDRATVEWPVALTTAKTCRVEMRSLHMDDQGKMRTDWLNPPVVDIRQNGDRFFAELRALRPGAPHTIRVVPVAREGETAEPLFLVQFMTLLPHDPPIRITKFRVAMFLLVVLAAGGFAWKRLRKEEEAW